jgi:hypothetical protein
MRPLRIQIERCAALAITDSLTHVRKFIYCHSLIPLLNSSRIFMIPMS